MALDVIKLARILPKARAGDTIARQIVRSAASAAANYRASGRAKSTADMIHKLKIVDEEADETLFWLELIQGSGMLPESELGALMQAADEIIAITVASIKSLRKRQT